ncbi:MAG: DUF2288 domain-containing protein [Parahaliea sp.]
MSEQIPAETDRESLLRREYHQQTGRIPWVELQSYYARGSVIRVSTELDLVEVAVQLGLDNTACFEAWITEGGIAAPSENEALFWYESQAVLWAVVAAPWVLVQEHR